MQDTVQIVGLIEDYWTEFDEDADTDNDDINNPAYLVFKIVDVHGQEYDLSENAFVGYDEEEFEAIYDNEFETTFTVRKTYL